MADRDTGVWQLRRMGVGMLLALVVLGQLTMPGASAQEPLPSVTVNQVDASRYPDVTAVVTVLDSRGAPAQGLTPQTFAAQDGDTPVDVTGAQRVLDASLGLGVVLVIDVSGSMDGAPLAAAKQAATAFVQQLDQGDQAAVLAFNNDVRVAVDFTSDKAALSAGINGLTAGGATSLYEAVQVAAFAANAHPAPRHAIVMLSDGENDTTTSAATDVGSLAAAEGARVPVFAIGFGGAADPAYLGRLADATRGRYFAASQADIGGVYATIADQLRGQYALALRSPAEADGAEGSLVVSVEVDGQRVASAPVAFTRGVAPVVPPRQEPPSEPASSDDGGGSALALIVAGVVGAVLVVGVIALLLMRRAAAARRQRVREQGAGRQSEAPLPPPIPGAPVAHAHDERASVCGVSGEMEGHTFHFGGTPLVFGTDPKADVRLGRSREVAPRHAMLWVRDGKIMLRHTGGARQTLSAGRPVDWLILEEGDEFSIGPHRWRIEAAVGVSANGSGAASAGRDASS